MEMLKSRKQEMDVWTALGTPKLPGTRTFRPKWILPAVNSTPCWQRATKPSCESLIDTKSNPAPQVLADLQGRCKLFPDETHVGTAVAGLFERIKWTN